MSYDVHLETTQGTARRIVSEEYNYTYNVSPMFKKALGCSLTELSGLQGVRVARCLDDAIADMELHPREYRAMNPANGWGDYEGALAFLKAVRAECRHYPLATVRVL